MNKIKNILVALILPSIIFSQNNPTINAKTKAFVVESVSKLLIENYVFPDTAVKMTNYIKKRFKEGAYDKISNPISFGGTLLKELNSIHTDLHLQLVYDPKKEKQSNNLIATQTKRDDPIKGIIQQNFGLKKVEIFPGNIGYIDMQNFWAAKEFGSETVKAALQFVSNTNALIIDLRTNNGGSGETVALIIGYFFKDSTHINDMYNRTENTTTAFWTHPDSSFNKLTNIPLYILTSKRTFSAAEEFAYDLQCLKRTTTIGEITGGGAHPVFERPVGEGFFIKIPYGRAINPITKTNWETVGVKPDIATTSDKALETAQMKIFDSLIKSTTDSSDLFDLKWQYDLLKANINAVTIDSVTLKKYSGEYGGERSFVYKDGKLFYSRAGGPEFELEPMTKTIMKGKGNAYYKIEFIENTQGQIEQLRAHYQDHRIETADRTK